MLTRKLSEVPDSIVVAYCHPLVAAGFSLEEAMLQMYLGGGGFKTEEQATEAAIKQVGQRDRIRRLIGVKN